MQTEEQTPKVRRWAGRTAAVAAAVATVMIGSIAAATWTLTGEGDGSAEATVAESLIVSIAAIDLYPGLTADATLTVSNPNAFDVRITAITFDGELVITLAETPPAGTCDATTSLVTFNDKTSLTLDVPAGAENEALVVVGAVTMGAGSDNACQGATFDDGFSLAAQIHIP